MLEQCSDPKELWQGVEALLQSWLEERKHTLELYCQLRENTVTPRWFEIEHFMQVLLDYVSAGHFEIYDKLVNEAQIFDDKSSKLADILYPKIHDTTQAALDFNDKYSSEENWENRQQDFLCDIENLGKQLAVRAEMEDSLIEQLHDNHKPE